MCMCYDIGIDSRNQGSERGELRVHDRRKGCYDQENRSSDLWCSVSEYLSSVPRTKEGSAATTSTLLHTVLPERNFLYERVTMHTMMNTDLLMRCLVRGGENEHLERSF